MGVDGIPEDVKQFIFECIDSVEQLEVLFLLYRNSEKGFTAKGISAEMRTSPESAELRLGVLLRSGLVSASSGDEPQYNYRKFSNETDAVIERLIEAYRVRPYKVLELIFSPMKKARGFAEAFVVTRKKNEDPHG